MVLPFGAAALTPSKTQHNEGCRRKGKQKSKNPDHLKLSAPSGKPHTWSCRLHSSTTAGCCCPPAAHSSSRRPTTRHAAASRGHTSHCHSLVRSSFRHPNTCCHVAFLDRIVRENGQESGLKEQGDDVQHRTSGRK